MILHDNVSVFLLKQHIQFCVLSLIQTVSVEST